jgi:hypothetical protein
LNGGSPIRFSLAALALAAALVLPAAATATPQQLAVDRALAYLGTQQGSDGCIHGPNGADPAASDWAAIAFARNGVDPASVQQAGGASLRDCLVALTALPPGTSALSAERHTLALVAAGLDPTSTNGVDLVAFIEGTFDGTQLGDRALLNDDVFGLEALTAAGVPASNPIVQADRAFVLGEQQPSGAFSFEAFDAANPDAFAVLFADADDTAQAIVALTATGSVATDVPVARADGFLLGTRNVDGGCGWSPLGPAVEAGFGALSADPTQPTAFVAAVQHATQSNSDSTSWTVMGIVAQGQDAQAAPWVTPTGASPISFLLGLQQADGSFAYRPASAFDGAIPSFAPASSTAYAALALGGHTFLA